VQIKSDENEWYSVRGALDGGFGRLDPARFVALEGHSWPTTILPCEFYTWDYVAPRNGPAYLKSLM